MPIECDRCNKEATIKFHYLSKPNEFYFCHDHAKDFMIACNILDVDYIRGTL